MAAVAVFPLLKRSTNLVNHCRDNEKNFKKVMLKIVKTFSIVEEGTVQFSETVKEQGLQNLLYSLINLGRYGSMEL